MGKYSSLCISGALSLPDLTLDVSSGMLDVERMDGGLYAPDVGASDFFSTIGLGGGSSTTTVSACTPILYNMKEKTQNLHPLPYIYNKKYKINTKNIVIKS